MGPKGRVCWWSHLGSKGVCRRLRFKGEQGRGWVVCLCSLGWGKALVHWRGLSGRSRGPDARR